MPDDANAADGDDAGTTCAPTRLHDAPQEKKSKGRRRVIEKENRPLVIETNTMLLHGL